jgi:threonine dehydratase
LVGWAPNLIGCADYDEAELRAKEHAATGSAAFISPYSHPDVIAGRQRSAGNRGTGTGGRYHRRPGWRWRTLERDRCGSERVDASRGIIGVEVEASCPFKQGLAAGRIVHIDVGQTLADGLSGNLDPDTITFDIVRTLVDRMIS